MSKTVSLITAGRDLYITFEMSMMKAYTSILLLALCLIGITANAQTPFDSFAPETSRPMLGLDAITSRENLSQCNGFNDSVLNTEPSADDISKWLSVDPLVDKYPNISPYAYCSWNPVNRIDPDGKADYYDVDGNHLYNDGVDDRRVLQQNINGDIITEGFALPFSYLGDVTSVKLEYNGEMTKENHKSIGELSLKQIGENFEFVRATYDALSGSRSLDCLPNGDYDTKNFRTRTAEAMVKEGVGFSIDLYPLFDTNRDYLRIHPDGKLPGTEGCIGLTGDQETLNSFVKLMQPLYDTYGTIPLKVNIYCNPNYHHF